jgi:hypothetical protein
MLMFDFRDIGWWYWLVTGVLLTVAIVGVPIGFDLAISLAIALSVIQIVHYYLREGLLTAFPVQLRIAVFLLLLLTKFDPSGLVVWVPLTGAAARVLFGYCMMARIISLLPWNRGGAFSVALLGQTFLSAPKRGNILQGLPPVTENVTEK